MALAGGSAGGHLATLAAFTPGHDDERVDACVGLYAIYDMANRNRTRAHWAKVPNVVIRATVEQAPARYRDLSPIDRIHDATPPMLVIHGTRDTLVPVREGEQFVEAMRDAGAPSTTCRCGERTRSTRSPPSRGAPRGRGPRLARPHDAVRRYVGGGDGGGA